MFTRYVQSSLATVTMFIISTIGLSVIYISVKVRIARITLSDN